MQIANCVVQINNYYFQEEYGKDSVLNEKEKYKF
jgi:hypothetical protein